MSSYIFLARSPELVQLALIFLHLAGGNSCGILRGTKWKGHSFLFAASQSRPCGCTLVEEKSGPGTAAERAK